MTDERARSLTKRGRARFTWSHGERAEAELWTQERGGRVAAWSRGERAGACDVKVAGAGKGAGGCGVELRARGEGGCG
ncbi:hypothetical protein GCM10009850_082800 [Nonomuraea monospora]|uniref:Uncharacterized protein n=1 Tax=Nonomuraea monospora TaxID=568818 RepID=A0ABN3CTN2_9ACTN